jgi:hypothetical protein
VEDHLEGWSKIRDPNKERVVPPRCIQKWSQFNRIHGYTTVSFVEGEGSKNLPRDCLNLIVFCLLSMWWKACLSSEEQHVALLIEDACCTEIRLVQLFSSCLFIAMCWTVNKWSMSETLNLWKLLLRINMRTDLNLLYQMNVNTASSPNNTYI